ncbi:sigma-70 family RNA polymerase sigma factor [Paraburkholderia silviterrae]|uniref:RNA polymerase sigma factor n=1 Tax=Paraburkholderia silviterrae TaxID=2528715 RepID=A0A4R5LX82_9BURK|nr:sigma-70 family RNA polymerase sigma factor [Paraburkholderia silviterrae]TDG16588.1 sigma-70 family RNA polymerase sigma factor [Paraburkholderia silviterrae]
MNDLTTIRRFETLVIPHMNSAYSVARWLTHNDQDAQDVVQEAYVKAFRFIDSFQGVDARAWLLTIVRNAFYTWYQQNKARAAESQVFEEDAYVPEPGDGGIESPEVLVMRDQNRKQVNKALSMLSLEHREIIVLREIEELSYKEIAGIVGIPMGTVMSRLGRGRQQLASILARMGQEA